MSKKGIICGTAILGSAMIAAILTMDSEKFVFANGTPEENSQTLETYEVPENDNIEELPRHKTNSLSLAPGLYIPESTEFINQEIPWEDVQKTLNLEEVKKATTETLALLTVEPSYHLGKLTQEMTEHQIQLFKESMADYVSKVNSASESALYSYEIYSILNEFNSWVDSYKTAITDDITLKEELAKKEIEEVVALEDSLVAMDVTHNISYGIPKLGDEYLTYMPYYAITAKATPHYRLQQLAETNEQGYRTYKGAICIALASAYGTKIGTLYNIEFEDGKTMRAILGDNKSDKHTDSLNQYRDATGAYNGASGNILEIIFDPENYDSINAVNRKINGDYPAKIKSITSLGVVEGFGE